MLNARQEAFVRAYAGPGTGAAAAAAAGYQGSPQTLKVRASKLLAHPDVRDALAARGPTDTRTIRVRVRLRAPSPHDERLAAAFLALRRLVLSADAARMLAATLEAMRGGRC